MKNLSSPWITKGTKKSSRKEQHFYEKFLQNKTTKRLETYKQYKTLFENFFKRSKRRFNQKKIQKCGNNIKTIWKIIKEIIGKSKVFHENFPNTLRINKTSITDKNVIADRFNEFFVNVGSSLASKIPPSNKNFDLYLPHISRIFTKNSINKEEFKKAFFFVET